MTTEYCDDISAIDSLTKILCSANINDSDRAILSAMRKSSLENYIKSHHKYDITPYKGKYFATRISSSKKIYAKSLDELYKKLYSYYSGKTLYETATISSIFDKALEWHASENCNTQKTMIRHKQIFDSRIKGSDLAEMPIKDISARNIKAFLKTFSDCVTRKTLTNIKTIINFVLEYACEELQLIPYNIAIGVKTSSIKVLPEKNVCDDAFSEFEIRRLVSHLVSSDNVYDEAIVFSVFVGLRPAELEALEWDDVHSDTLILRRANTERGNLKTGDHAQTHKHLCKDAVMLLERYRQERPDSVLIFPNNEGKRLDGDVINKHLRKACKTLDMPYRSIYKTRAYVVTQIASTGDYEASRKTAGHSNSYMQDHYINNRLTDANRSNIEKALNLGISTSFNQNYGKEKTS